MKNLITYERSLFESFMNEGAMSDIHQLANEVKSETEFINKFFKDYGNKIKRTKESEEWLKSLYLDMSESKVTESFVAYTENSKGEYEVVKVLKDQRAAKAWRKKNEYLLDDDSVDVKSIGTTPKKDWDKTHPEIAIDVVDEEAIDEISQNEGIFDRFRKRSIKGTVDKEPYYFDIADKALLYLQKKDIEWKKYKLSSVGPGDKKTHIRMALSHKTNHKTAETEFMVYHDKNDNIEKVVELEFNYESVNEAKSQIKRKYGQYKAINVYEKASIRNGVLRFVGKRFVTEEELKMQLTRISEDRGKSIDQRKWLQRNMKYFESTTNRGQNVLSLSKFGSRVFERILKLDSDKNKLSINESIGLFKTSLLNEARDINDPVLMAIRANKHDREKKLAMAIQKKRPLYGKERTKAQYQLLDISQELKDLYDERANLYSDMENEAGQKGDKWSDDDANRYGGELNDVESKIEELIIKRSKLELKLAI